MGCDIHLIVEINEGGKWQHIPKRPESLCQRNYDTFAALAGVRNYSDINGFEPKGLPSDISGKKFLFNSEMEFIKRWYEDETKVLYQTSDGKYHHVFDDELNKIVDSFEEASKYKNWHIYGKNQYVVFCPEEFGAVRCNIPIKELYPSLEEYARIEYSDEWNEEMQDYGYWEVDFDSCDYHTPSYLTLQELLDYCNDGSYTLAKVEIPKLFYDRFIELGGIMPDGIVVKKSLESEIDEDVTVLFESEERPELSNLKTGVDELKKIAAEYNVEPGNIRIVFAFDN